MISSDLQYAHTNTRTQAAEVLLLEAEQRVVALQQSKDSLAAQVAQLQQTAAEEAQLKEGLTAQMQQLQQAVTAECEAKASAQASVLELQALTASLEAKVGELEQNATIQARQAPLSPASAAGAAVRNAAAAAVVPRTAVAAVTVKSDAEAADQEAVDDSQELPHTPQGSKQGVPSLADLAQSVHKQRGVLSKLLQEGSPRKLEMGGVNALEGLGRSEAQQQGESGDEGLECGSARGSEGGEEGEWVSVAVLQSQLLNLGRVTEEVAAQYEAMSEKVDALRCVWGW